MAKNKSSSYICENCGKPYYKYQFQCYECNGKVVENIVQSENVVKTFSNDEDSAQLLKDIKITQNSFIKLQSKELNTFFGSGKGIQNSLFGVLSGAPGCGKSTFLSQLCNIFAEMRKKVIYNSGEESKEQVKSRTDRLFEKDDEYFYVSSKKNIHELIYEIEKVNPELLIIDSIQTIYNPDNDGVRGGVSQIKDVTELLMSICKRKKIVTFIICHVDKDGDMAGPKYLEHMVDAVFFLESVNSSLKFLSSSKNRFGKVDLLVLELKDNGLSIVSNPSAKFIAERPENPVGSVIVPLLEGTGSMLIEIQSIVQSSNFNSYPLRNVFGIDKNKLIGLLATIEKHIPKMSLATHDVYIKVAGGLKVKDDSSDLAIVKSILSSYKNDSVLIDSIYIGEVGFAGEVRSVSMIETRISESYKIGIKHAYIPFFNKNDINESKFPEMKFYYIKHINEIS